MFSKEKKSFENSVNRNDIHKYFLFLEIHIDYICSIGSQILRQYWIESIPMEHQYLKSSKTQDLYLSYFYRKIQNFILLKFTYN